MQSAWIISADRHQLLNKSIQRDILVLSCRPHRQLIIFVQYLTTLNLSSLPETPNRDDDFAIRNASLPASRDAISRLFADH